MAAKLGNTRRALAIGSVLAVAGTVSLSGAASGNVARAVRGFDGQTITVGGFGIKGQLPKIEDGARARFKKFNDSNEIKGVKINMTEFSDDGQDPATALSIARRLVTETHVFAVVPNGSANTPGPYLTQQHVPWFGGGFDISYCSTKPSTSVWGFSVLGCTSPSNPSFVPDFSRTMYAYVSKQTGKKHPTFASVANDSQSGKNANHVNSVSAKEIGFKVVGTFASMPLQVSDYTPYAQQLMTADKGSPPDMIFCNAAGQCLGIWSLLKAQGYKGYYFSPLYVDALAKPMAGSYVHPPYANLDSSSPGLDQMRKDLNAYQNGSGDKPDIGSVFGYASADFFVQVLKKVAAAGKNKITPENVQKAASKMHWQLPGFMQIWYPEGTVGLYPSCFSDAMSTGTAWVQVSKYSCSTKKYPNKS